MINISSPFWIDQKSNLNYIAYIQTKENAALITLWIPKKDYYKQKPQYLNIRIIISTL